MKPMRFKQGGLFHTSIRTVQDKAIRIYTGSRQLLFSIGVGTLAGLSYNDLILNQGKLWLHPPIFS